VLVWGLRRLRKQTSKTRARYEVIRTGNRYDPLRDDSDLPEPATNPGLIGGLPDKGYYPRAWGPPPISWAQPVKVMQGTEVPHIKQTDPLKRTVYGNSIKRPLKGSSLLKYTLVGLPNYNVHCRVRKYLKADFDPYRLPRSKKRDSRFEIYPERVFTQYVSLCLSIEESLYSLLDYVKRRNDLITPNARRAVHFLVHCYDARLGYLASQMTGTLEQRLQSLAPAVFRFLRKH